MSDDALCFLACVQDEADLGKILQAFQQKNQVSFRLQRMQGFSQLSQTNLCIVLLYISQSLTFYVSRQITFREVSNSRASDIYVQGCCTYRVGVFIQSGIRFFLLILIVSLRRFLCHFFTYKWPFPNTCLLLSYSQS